MPVTLGVLEDRIARRHIVLTRRTLLLAQPQRRQLLVRHKVIENEARFINLRQIRQVEQDWPLRLFHLECRTIRLRRNARITEDLHQYRALRRRRAIHIRRHQTPTISHIIPVRELREHRRIIRFLAHHHVDFMQRHLHQLWNRERRTRRNQRLRPCNPFAETTFLIRHLWIILIREKGKIATLTLAHIRHKTFQTHRIPRLIHAVNRKRLITPTDCVSQGQLTPLIQTHMAQRQTNTLEIQQDIRIYRILSRRHRTQNLRTLLHPLPRRLVDLIRTILLANHRLRIIQIRLTNLCRKRIIRLLQRRIQRSLSLFGRQRKDGIHRPKGRPNQQKHSNHTHTKKPTTLTPSPASPKSTFPPPKHAFLIHFLLR